MGYSRLSTQDWESMKHNYVIHQTQPITREILEAIQPEWPLEKSVVGIRIISQHLHVDDFWPCHLCTFRCLLHAGTVVTGQVTEPLTLEQAGMQEAWCVICKTRLSILPDSSEWNLLQSLMASRNKKTMEKYKETLSALQLALQNLPEINDTLTLDQRREVLVMLEQCPKWINRVRNSVPMSEWHLLDGLEVPYGE